MRVGVCSWSLQPESPADLVRLVTSCGVRSVQLALDPLLSGAWRVDVTQDVLAQAGIEILSAMVQTAGEDYTTLESIQETGGLRPDAQWDANYEMAQRAAELCCKLGCDLVTFHAGFMPHDRNHPEYSKLLDRVSRFVEVFADVGICVALETGQESAETLNEFLKQINSSRLGVNFDPANMILYGMGDPVASLKMLRNHVMQIHLKDANPSDVPGQWGQEVPIGEGAVDWGAFFAVISEHGIRVNTMIEREAGDSRVEDIRAGLGFLEPRLQCAGALV